MEASGDSPEAVTPGPTETARAAAGQPASLTGEQDTEARSTARTMAVELRTGLITAAGPAIVAALESDRVLMFAALGFYVCLLCVLYFLGDIRRGVRRARRLQRDRVRRRRARRPTRHGRSRRQPVSVILSPETLPPESRAASGPDQPAAGDETRVPARDDTGDDDTGEDDAGEDDAGEGPAAAEEDQRTGTTPSYRRRVIAGVMAATVFGFVIGYWAIGEGFAHGLVTGIGVLVALAAAIAAGIAWVRRRQPARLSWLGPWRNSMLAVGVAALGLSAGGTFGTSELTVPVRCPPPTELRVLASAEILGPLQAAITGFEQDEAAELGTSCYAVDITAYAAANDKAADDEMLAAWNLANGPRPDIWIPASIEELPTGQPGPHQPATHVVGSVASSPIVVALPAGPTAARLAAEERNMSLGNIYQAISGDFSLTVPNPRLSEAGQLAIADPSLTAAQLQRMGQSGAFPPDSGSVLCQAAQPAQGKPAAYLVSAAAVFASSRHALGAAGCASAPAGALTEISPANGSVLDFPLTTVTWPGVPVTAAVTAAEQDFFRWLTSPPRHTPLLADGLQAPGPTANLLTPDAVAAAVREFSRGQPPARILVAVDDSAPMRPYLSEIGQAVDGVLGPQGQGGHLEEGRDSVGLWTFPGPAGSGTPGRTEQRLLPVGPDTASQRAALERAVGGITAHDHSAEFDLVADAAKHDSGANSLVLLTDGDDQQVDAAGNSIVTVSRQLGFLAGQGSPVKVYVIAFGPAGCAETPSGSPAYSLTALADAGGGTCVAAASGSASLQQQIARDVSTLSTGG